MISELTFSTLLSVSMAKCQTQNSVGILGVTKMRIFIKFASLFKSQNTIKLIYFRTPANFPAVFVTESLFQAKQAKQIELVGLLF